GIRDGHVTGVQTCALPISPDRDQRRRGGGRTSVGQYAQDNSTHTETSEFPRRDWYLLGFLHTRRSTCGSPGPCSGSPAHRPSARSEERRVGKEGRST